MGFGARSRHESLERAGPLEEKPYRRRHRRCILHRAAEPLATLPGPAAYDRLLKSLSLIDGIASWVALWDIWTPSDRDVMGVTRFMLEALIESALSRAPAAGRLARPKRRGYSLAVPKRSSHIPSRRGNVMLRT